MRLRLSATCRLFAALACLLSWQCSWACGPYTVALYEFGSFYHRNADGGFSGIDKDIVEALARRSGCVLNQRLESRVRIWDQLERGALDLSVSGIATPERQRFADFYPYLAARNHALMSLELAQRLPTASAFMAAREHRVAVVRSFRHGPKIDGWIEQLRLQGRVDEVPDVPTALRVLEAGRVSLVFIHPMALLPWKPEMQRRFALLDWAPGDTILAGLVVSRSRVSLADQHKLRQHLEAMLADGEVFAILRQHLGSEMAQRVQYHPPAMGNPANTAGAPASR